MTLYDDRLYDDGLSNGRSLVGIHKCFTVIVTDSKGEVWYKWQAANDNVAKQMKLLYKLALKELDHAQSA